MRKKLREQLIRLVFNRDITLKFEGHNLCYYVEILFDGSRFNYVNVYDDGSRVEAVFSSIDTVIDVMMRDGVVYLRP